MAAIVSDPPEPEWGVLDFEVDVFEIDDYGQAEVFMNWLADCWEQAGGLNARYPAEAFFHGYHLDRFDLRSRQWYRLGD
jgi:hypothetical protein